MLSLWREHRSTPVPFPSQVQSDPLRAGCITPTRELLSLYLWLPPHFPALPTLSQPHGSAVAPMIALLLPEPDPLTSVLGSESRHQIQDAHAWRGCFTVFHVLCNPGIMLFYILLFSLNVLLEGFLLTLNTIFRQLAA